MPRGWKPGERRGGRQRGTPNKKTALRNAAICATAADSNVSPLDLLLALMRDPNLDLELRVVVAEAALPFVHAKPKEPSRKKTVAMKYGASPNLVNVTKRADTGPRDTEPVKTSAITHEGIGDAEMTPLDFLLGFMRHADTPLHLRIRVTAVVAPYVHPKRAAKPEIVVDDPYGFNIDPAVAWAIWENADESYSTQLDPVGVPRIAEERLAKLGLRLAAKIAALKCPEGYGLKEATSDLFRMQKLFRKGTGKREARDAEEAHLLARLWAYNKSSEASGRARLWELRQSKPPLTAEEQSERDRLTALYPEPPLDPDHPHYGEIEKERLISELLQARVREIRGVLESQRRKGATAQLADP